MTLISVSQAQDGVTGVNAASLNTPINTIVNDYNGKITDANISSSAAIAASKIAGGVAGMFGAWTSYTPTFTNLTVGNGTLTARYVQLGKTVMVRGTLSFGSTTSVSGFIALSFPVTSLTNYDNSQIIGWAAVNATPTSMVMPMRWTTSTTTQILSNSLSQTATSSTAPVTWASGNILSWKFEFEAA